MADNQTTEMPNMRDIFAMMAMNGLVSVPENYQGAEPEATAKWAYALADAMLKERQK